VKRSWEIFDRGDTLAVVLAMREAAWKTDILLEVVRTGM